MQIVIEIPKKVYNALTHIDFDASLVVNEMRKSIVNGTPLPIGHGRLVDLDQMCEEYWDGNSMEITKYDLSVIEPIIEAESE